MEERDAPLMTDPAPIPGAGPVAAHERIAALDVLRGFAILGIFTVNITFFSEPLFQGMHATHLADAALPDRLAWTAVRVFSEYKFVSLFSLLFGIGLVVQMNRAQERRADFVPVFLRRLLVLAAIGTVHGVLIWYGDILLMYAAFGFILLAMRKLQPRALIGFSVAFFLAGLFILSTCVGLGMLESRFQGADAPADIVAPDPGIEQTNDSIATGERTDDRWDRWWAALRDSQFNVEGDAFAEAETIAYKEGPFLAALIMRSLTFAAGIVFSFILGGFGFRVLAMFLLGAALMKLNFFDPSRRLWQMRLLVVGFLVGLPLEGLVAAARWHADFQMTWTALASESLHYAASGFLFLGYVGGVTLLASCAAARLLNAGLAAVGRMALTNYLAQSVIATFIMYWWGLGLFGEFSRSQQLMLVVAIFLGQVLFSVIWLRLFRFGPMEWLWRTLTYMKVQPMRREA